MKRKPVNRIFSVLDSDIICRHKSDILPENNNLLFHDHDGCEIYLFLSGNADYYVEGYGRKLVRGDLILSPAYSFHCSKADPNTRYERIFINIREHILSDLSRPDTDLSECFKHSAGEGISLISLDEGGIEAFTRLADSLEASLESSSYGSSLLTDALLTQIMIMVNRLFIGNVSVDHEGIMPELIHDVIGHINTHIEEDELSVKSLAERYHHNPDYLSRFFKSVTGISLRHFILIKKVTLAQNILRNGSSASDACYGAGFNNYSNFSRSFTNIVGMSPKKYQMMYRH